MSCAVLLSGALHSVAASPNQVLLVDDGATKVVKAVSLEDVIVMRLQASQEMVQAIVLDEPAVEFPNFEAVSVGEVELFSITPEQSAYRVRPPTIYTANSLTGYKPPAFRPEKTGKIYLTNCSIRQC